MEMMHLNYIKFIICFNILTKIKTSKQTNEINCNNEIYSFLPSHVDVLWH